MTAATIFARANELFVEEDFEQAASLYDQAVELDPSEAKFYLHRAANHLKLKNYMDVIPDVEKCLEFDPNNATAWFRKGMAYFSLSEFESALSSFEQANKLGSQKCDLWIRKCNAEIRKESGERPVTVHSSPAPATHTPKIEVVDEPVKKPQEEKRKEAAKPKEEKAQEAPSKPKEDKTKVRAVAMETTEDAPPVPETLATKVRPNWTQNLGGVQITLFAKNLTDDKVNVTLQDGVLRAVLSMPDSSTFDKTWNLYAPVNEDLMKVKVNPFKVEIILEKTTSADWKGLEAVAKPSGVVLRENQVSEGRVPAPYASHKDWNEVEQSVKQEEAAEKPEGNDALQKLFQQIYADGDPDVRRAMMKSYQTSGGTVLSTNWKDVKKKDYEKEGIMPPKGQEVRKWTE